MNNKLKTILGVAAVALVSAAVAGAAVWHYAPQLAAAAPAAGQKAQAEVKAELKADARPAKYVTLDKVIVMLRRGPNEVQSHYLSADLVLATTADNERKTKEHLPLLRSIAVGALSRYQMGTASAMTVQQYADELNRTFDASYAKANGEKPFTEVMIGKLIIE
ncbi:MAG TPA: flagellar basal body-associated FliL family protein [Telluria sp.]